MRHLSDIVLNQISLMLPSTELVADACRQMSESHVDSVLVVDEQKRLEGIFTGHDAVRRVIDSDRKSTSTHLADVMTPHPVTMRTDNSAIEALRLMWDCGFEHVPVVANDQVVGVVSQSDFGSDERIELEREREFWEHMR